MVWRTDLFGVIRGLQKVASAISQHQSQECQKLWATSSIRSSVGSEREKIAELFRSPSSTANRVGENVAEAVRRSGAVAEGLRQFVVVGLSSRSPLQQVPQQEDPSVEAPPVEAPYEGLQDHHRLRRQPEPVRHEPEPEVEYSKEHGEYESPKQAVFDLEQKGERPPHLPEDKLPKVEESPAALKYAPPIHSVKPGVKPLARSDPRSRLSAQAKERKVPSSRLGRLASYGGLAAGLGVGALAEVTRRSLGFKETKSSESLLSSSPFLTEANAERIVDTLCRVRGAALKIGQMLSIQDQSILDPRLIRIFERVRQSADFMPQSQMERMLIQEFGIDWRSKMKTFDEKPFAAASIGQVHLATLEDDRKVAVKIQYPGVAEGIESDISNLTSVLTVSNIFPKGLYLEEFVKVAREELSWEVDYIREAECAKKYKACLAPYTDYYVPEVIDELSTQRIYTTELIEGVTLDKAEEFDQETRNRIGYLVLRLFILELFGFQFMQTDPNWANFLFNKETDQMGLLDFGSCRGYSDDFVGLYIRIIRAAVDRDRAKILEFSRKVGFLTGYESKIMEDAHVESVLILGEAFTESGEAYDFGSQSISPRVQHMISVMLEHRLKPPPEEVYSVHRKLSGVFLLCTKLKSKVNCTSIFQEAWANYLTKNPGFDKYLHD